MSESPGRVLSLLRRLDAAREPEERLQQAKALMAAVYALGVATELGEVARDEARALREAAEPLLPRVTGALEIVAGSLEDRFMTSFEPGDWQDLSRLRSALEFLLELFPGEADWLRTHLRPDAYDDLIRRRSHDYGYLESSESPAGDTAVALVVVGTVGG